MTLLTLTRVAELTGLSVESLQRRCRRGLVPGASKPGTDWLIPEESVPAIPPRQSAGRRPMSQPPAAGA